MRECRVLATPMRRAKLLLLASIIMLSSSVGIARSVRPDTVSESFGRASVVAVVRIDKINPHYVGGLYCGDEIHGNAVRIFKGLPSDHELNAKKIRFGRAPGLKAGRRYLLFMTWNGSIEQVYEKNRDQINSIGGSPPKAAALPKQKALDIIRCENLVPGFQYDNDQVWRLDGGDFVTTTYWPRAPVPADVPIHREARAKIYIRQQDFYVFLSRLGSMSGAEHKRHP